MPKKKLKEADRWKPSGWTHGAINPKLCRASVYGRAGWGGSHQCSGKAKHGDPPEWCGTHSPEAIERREEKRRARAPSPWPSRAPAAWPAGREKSREWQETWKARARKDAREARLVKSALKMLEPATWGRCAAEISELLLDAGGFRRGGAPDELADVIAKHARKILGEERS
jgi:hypothetical protein